MSFTYYNGGLLFSASNYDNGQELWRYAATAASTAAARLAPALALWPNPAQGRANAQLPAGLEARELTLTDALGRVVRTQALPPSAGPARHELDLRGLAPGLYVVRCGPAAGQLQVE